MKSLTELISDIQLSIYKTRLDLSMKIRLWFSIGLCVLIISNFMYYESLNTKKIFIPLGLSLGYMAYIFILGKYYNFRSFIEFNYLPHIISIIDLMVITVIINYLPRSTSLILFSSIELIYVSLIIISHYSISGKNMIIITILVSISFFINYMNAFYIAHDTLLKINKVAFFIANPLTAITTFFYMVGIGILLSIYSYTSNQFSKEINDIIHSKTLTGAHKSLTADDGVHLFNEWTVFTTIEAAKDNMIGSDFIGLKDYGSDGAIGILGDVISHGLDTSQGAFACLATFHSSKTLNPKIHIDSINRVLNKIDREYGGEAHACCFYLGKEGEITLFGGLEIPIAFVNFEQNKIINIPLVNFILGKKQNILLYNKITIKLGPEDILVLKTDGWEHQDKDDDKTLVIISRRMDNERKN